MKLRKKFLSYKWLIYRLLLKMIKVFLKKFKKVVDARAQIIKIRPRCNALSKQQNKAKRFVVL